MIMIMSSGLSWRSLSLHESGLASRRGESNPSTRMLHGQAVAVYAGRQLGLLFSSEVNGDLTLEQLTSRCLIVEGATQIR